MVGVTVVIAARNRPRLSAAAIGSVLRQDEVSVGIGAVDDDWQIEAYAQLVPIRRTSERRDQEDRVNEQIQGSRRS